VTAAAQNSYGYAIRAITQRSGRSTRWPADLRFRWPRFSLEPVNDERSGPGDITIVVVEDHTLVREGTAELLERAPGLRVVGQAGSAEDAMGLLARTGPDVLVADVELPGMNGIDLARQVARAHPAVRVLILSAYDDYAYVIGALEAGVAGYLLKTASARELRDAVRTAASGALVLDRAISRRLTSRWRGGASHEAASLTDREADVLRLVAKGLSNRQIAGVLGLGVRTVESHVSSVLGKLGLASRTEAALYAVSHRMVPLDQPRDRA
jgi:DNA-binding NarL/FixJ family response regulator